MKSTWGSIVGIRSMKAFAVSVVCILAAATSGCNSSSGMSFQDFIDALRSKALVKGTDTAFHAVIKKSDLVGTFGQPHRIQQTGDKVLLYYGIADGMLCLEGVAAYWNGTEKFVYLDSEPVPPVEPTVSSLGAQDAVKTLGGQLEPQISTRLAQWYQKSNPNPYKIQGPGERGWFTLLEDGKPQYVPNIRDMKDKKAFEDRVTELLAGKALDLLRARDKEFRENWMQSFRRDHQKTVDEPCLVVLETRVH